MNTKLRTSKDYGDYQIIMAVAQVCPLSDRDMMLGHLHSVQDRVQGRMVLTKRLQMGGGGGGGGG